MNLIQVILFTALQALSDSLPLDSRIAEHLLTGQLQWPTPPLGLVAAIKLSSFLAIIVYFRHDVLSLISSFLSILIFRRKPMTMDERLPFFILLTALFPILSHTSVIQFMATQEIPFWVMSLSSGLAILMIGFADQMSRRTKAYFDWTTKEAIILGVAACASTLPGMGFMTAALIAALFANFNREAASKYAFLVLAPYLLFQGILSWSRGHAETAPFIQGGEQLLIPNLTLDTLALILVLFASFAVTWISVSSWMKSVERGAIRSVIGLRILFVLSLPISYWLINR